jgi:hypothetical protein
VNHFEWADDQDDAFFEGHLKKGRVYQATENIVDGVPSYRININLKRGENSAIVVDHLTGEYEKCTYKLTRVEGESIMDLDILDKDMEMMAYERSHLDSITIEAELPKPEMVTEGDKSKIAIEKTVELLKAIEKEDSDMVKFLLLIINETKEALEDNTYLPLTDALSMRQDNIGRVVNSTLIAAHVEGHLNSTDNNPTHLLNAVFTILLELKRTVKTS